MSVIRMPEQVWSQVHDHLLTGPGERFAFLLAEPCQGVPGPIFLVKDVLCVPERHTKLGPDGWSLTPEGYLQAINAAIKSNAALVEAHNHGGIQPRFSRTDREGLAEFVPYVLDSLPARPYGATVWGDSTIYGEFFTPEGTTGVVRSVTAIGAQFQQLVSNDDDRLRVDSRFDRQLPWFTETGQQLLCRVRVAVVGAGGTGSHVLQQLAYLGIRDFVIVEPDSADQTSMNRLVSATAADIGTPKAILARRLIKSVAPNACVASFATGVQSKAALDALKSVDVVFGCVDNDGARLILTELSRAYCIPYFDVAVGIDVETRVVRAGGRLAVVTPGGPCLFCMKEIDRQEAHFFLSDRKEQQFQLERGYVEGLRINAPSVVSLNASAAAMVVNEFAILFSGLRQISHYSELDLLGVGRTVKGQWIGPRHVGPDPKCVLCAVAGTGDRAAVDRYVEGGR